MLRKQRPYTVNPREVREARAADRCRTLRPAPPRPAPTWPHPQQHWPGNQKTRYETRLCGFLTLRHWQSPLTFPKLVLGARLPALLAAGGSWEAAPGHLCEPGSPAPTWAASISQAGPWLASSSRQNALPARDSRFLPELIFLPSLLLTGCIHPTAIEHDWFLFRLWPWPLL